MKESHGAMALQTLFIFPNEIIKLLPQNKRKLIIQAGGNAGLYPKLYSTMFEKVITFEPDHRWFVCLINNCS